MTNKDSRRCQGFTLTEALVAIAIIAVLIGLLLPAVMKARATSARVRCANNLKQMALGVHSFHGAENRLPYSQYGYYGGIQHSAGPKSTAWSWIARTLPHFEQQALYRTAGVPQRRLNTSPTIEVGVPLFLCPADPDATLLPRTDCGNMDGVAVGRSTYKGVSGANWGDDISEFQVLPGAFATDWRNKGVNGSYDGLTRGDGLFYRKDQGRPLSLHQIADGTSQTLMIGEDVQVKNTWISWGYANNTHGTCAIPLNVQKPSGGGYPPNEWQNTFGFRSLHPGGANFAFADGSVRFVPDGVLLEVYRGMATISGGEDGAS